MPSSVGFLRFWAAKGFGAVMACLLGLGFSAQASLLDERMINPLDAFTAQVLHEGEWLYGQPPALAPGWMFWGITERLTAELDLMAWLGGVADMNVRYGLVDPEKNPFGLAWENMAFYLPPALGDMNKNQEHVFFEREGAGAYSRLNSSWQFMPRQWLLLSVGASYSHYLRIENKNRPEFQGAFFSNYTEPVVSLGLDSRWASWLSVHATASYGETFSYQENRPRKEQLTYGFRFAPFLGNTWGVFNTLRVELAAFVIYYRDAQELQALYVPVYPSLYWQW